MFSEELEKYSWEETTREIYSKTAADVELALSKSQLAIDDFMAPFLRLQRNTWNRWPH